MPVILLKIGARLFGARFARAGLVVSIILLAIAAFFIGKAIYDRTLIARHEARADAKAQGAARKASETATARDIQRQADFRASQDIIKEKVDDAKDNGGSPLDAYFGGLRDDDKSDKPAR